MRADLNTPLSPQGTIADDTRLRAILPTIELLQNKGATRLVILAHLGRPTEGMYEDAYSLKPVAERLQHLLQQPVVLVQQDKTLPEAGICLLENVRFFKGEKANDSELARYYASLGDIFVMEAFGCAHRAQSSTHGVIQYAKKVAVGPLFIQETQALDKILHTSNKPLLAIIGGSKISTKIGVLKGLAEKVDTLVVGGGIANVFMAAQGYNIGKSINEPEMYDVAREILEKCHIPLPEDVIVAKGLDMPETAKLKSINEVDKDDMILDVGPKTATHIGNIALEAGTILWNGPLGVFEVEAFASGTRILANHIAQSKAFSLAGGGDTLAAINQFKIGDSISYTSTGGGAFLEYIEKQGKLPVIEVMNNKENHGVN